MFARLSWKSLPGTKTLACYENADKQSFITLGQRALFAFWQVQLFRPSLIFASRAGIWSTADAPTLLYSLFRPPPFHRAWSVKTLLCLLFWNLTVFHIILRFLWRCVIASRDGTIATWLPPTSCCWRRNFEASISDSLRPGVSAIKLFFVTDVSARASPCFYSSYSNN